MWIRFIWLREQQTKQKKSPWKLALAWFSLPGRHCALLCPTNGGCREAGSCGAQGDAFPLSFAAVPTTPQETAAGPGSADERGSFGSALRRARRQCPPCGAVPRTRQPRAGRGTGKPGPQTRTKCQVLVQRELSSAYLRNKTSSGFVFQLKKRWCISFPDRTPNSYFVFLNVVYNETFSGKNIV